MANDVKAMDTINIATIFAAVTNATVGSVDPFCTSDVRSSGRGDKNIDTSMALWYKRGLNSS